MNTLCFWSVFPKTIKNYFFFLAACLTLTLSLYSQSLLAQTADRAKLIVSYSYNFAKNIEWPQEIELDAFTIALFDVTNNEIISEFMKLNNRVNIKDVPIRIIQTRNPQALLNANMVYIGNNEKNAEIQNMIGNSPILLITKNAKNKRLVMINMFRDQNQAIKFEVNKANLINNNLNALTNLAHNKINS